MSTPPNPDRYARFFDGRGLNAAEMGELFVLSESELIALRVVPWRHPAWSSAGVRERGEAQRATLRDITACLMRVRNPSGMETNLWCCTTAATWLVYLRNYHGNQHADLWDMLEAAYVLRTLEGM